MIEIENFEIVQVIVLVIIYSLLIIYNNSRRGNWEVNYIKKKYVKNKIEYIKKS